MPENLQEFVDSRGVKLGVDRERGIISGVKVLGTESRNGRTYPASAISKAAPLYEAAKVNVNHPNGNPTGPRDYRDRLGMLRNVRVDGAGLRADLHFNPKHALAEQLIWDAEHSPENVGLSHNVEAKTARRDGKVIVEEILKVQSVDLVADPATTRGLFESDDPTLAKKALVEELAAGINMPRWCIPDLSLGLSYCHTRDAIVEYLLDIKRIFIDRGILPNPDPVVESVTHSEFSARRLTGRLMMLQPTDVVRKQKMPHRDTSPRTTQDVNSKDFAKALLEKSARKRSSVQESSNAPVGDASSKDFLKRLKRR